MTALDKPTEKEKRRIKADKLTTTGISVNTTGFWYWLKTPTICIQSVECNEIPTLPLVQRDFCYPMNKSFLLVGDMWTNTCYKTRKVDDVRNSKQINWKKQMGLTWILDISPSVVKAMRHRLPFFLMTHPIRPFDEEIPALPIPIGIGHIGYQPRPLLPCSEVIYSLGWDDVLRTVAPEELVKS